MIHGWGGSHRSFDLSAEALASKGLQVIAVDLRFHGDSDKPSHGFHIHRIAADIKELLDHSCPDKKVVLLGASMGCAVIWAFCELYGTSQLMGAAFIDQAPLQNRETGWELGSKTCYDSATLEKLGEELKDLGAFAEANVKFCTNKPVDPEYAMVLKSEMCKCKVAHLYTLMRDHTQLDWRHILPRIDVFCLNLYGGQSNVFPTEGCEYVGKAIPKCVNKVYPDCNHWLYIENPEEFVLDVAEFVERCYTNTAVFVR